MDRRSEFWHLDRVGQVSGLLSPYVQRIRLKKVQEWLTGSKLLDFGCGTGDLVARLPAEIEYVGIDIDPRSLQVARRRYPGYEFLELPELDAVKTLGRFDTIVMAAVLEHLPNPEHHIRFLSKQSMEIGGRLIVTTPHPVAKFVLRPGARLKLLSSAAQEEHKDLVSRSDLERLAHLAELEILVYKRFLCRLNQLVVYRKAVR
jgi:2-polyprenyl-3-methyl-5-hydroxy-6-metoxy-1,4-benzoquinol methylase